MAALKAYDFPGNVRELRNILERASTLCEDDVIREPDLALGGASIVTAVPDTNVEQEPTNDEESASPAMPAGLPEDADSLESYLESIEKNVIVEALETTRWNKTAAAKKLGITFRALRYKLKKLGLE